MSGLVKALENCQKTNLNLFFGLKLSVCANMYQKETESLSTEYKIVIFMRDEKAYKNLLKIYSIASIEGFYYRPRIDCATLKKYWDDNLLLIHPFYYSFLHRNALYLSNCNPDFDFIKEHQFFIEKNDLPFNYLIEKAIDNFGIKNNIKKIPSKSIYYLNQDYFKAFVTNKAIHNRATLDCPNEEHLASSNFSFEEFKKE